MTEKSTIQPPKQAYDPPLPLPVALVPLPTDAATNTNNNVTRDAPQSKFGKDLSNVARSPTKDESSEKRHTLPFQTHSLCSEKVDEPKCTDLLVVDNQRDMTFTDPPTEEAAAAAAAIAEPNLDVSTNHASGNVDHTDKRVTDNFVVVPGDNVDNGTDAGTLGAGFTAMDIDSGLGFSFSEATVHVPPPTTEAAAFALAATLAERPLEVSTQRASSNVDGFDDDDNEFFVDLDEIPGTGNVDTTMDTIGAYDGAVHPPLPATDFGEAATFSEQSLEVSTDHAQATVELYQRHRRHTTASVVEVTQRAGRYNGYEKLNHVKVWYGNNFERDFDYESTEQIFNNLNAYLVTDDCKKLSGFTIAKRIRGTTELLQLQGRPFDHGSMAKMCQYTDSFLEKAELQRENSQSGGAVTLSDSDLLNIARQCYRLHGEMFLPVDLQVIAVLAWGYCTGRRPCEIHSTYLQSLTLTITRPDGIVVDEIPVGEEDGEWIRILSYGFVYAKGKGIGDYKQSIEASKDFHLNAPLLLMKLLEVRGILDSAWETYNGREKLGDAVKHCESAEDLKAALARATSRTKKSQRKRAKGHHGNVGDEAGGVVEPMDDDDELVGHYEAAAEERTAHQNPTLFEKVGLDGFMGTALSGSDCGKQVRAVVKLAGYLPSRSHWICLYSTRKGYASATCMYWRGSKEQLSLHLDRTMLNSEDTRRVHYTTLRSAR